MAAHIASPQAIFRNESVVRSRTELGHLGDSFNLMTDQLEHYINDLQRSADENRELFLGTVKESGGGDRWQGSLYPRSFGASVAEYR